MFRKAVLGLISIFILYGCATTDSMSGSDMTQLKNKVTFLEIELKKGQTENLALKEKVSEQQGIIDSLSQEKTILKMPTATEIQTALKNAGLYNGKVDGQIGTQTKEAIKKFQQANGLNPDGVIGSRTWEKLRKYLNPD